MVAGVWSPSPITWEARKDFRDQECVGMDTRPRGEGTAGGSEASY